MSEPWSATTIQAPGDEADNLLETIHNSPAEREREFAKFVQMHAAAIEATAQSLIDPLADLPTAISRVMLSTQTLIGQLGEVPGKEIAQATMGPSSPEALHELMPPIGMVYIGLTMGDASAAVASQRAGYSAELGRAVFAAKIIIELRTKLCELL